MNTTTTTYQTYANLAKAMWADTPYQLGRNLYKYTSCGPWTVFIVKSDGEETTIYYEDAIAHEMGNWTKNIIGIKIGSIVEGSDVEIDGKSLYFPFTSKDLDNAVQSINEEANFYWQRDNTDNYTITKNGKYVASTSWTNFDSKPKWLSDIVITPYWKKKIWTCINEKRTVGWSGDFKLVVGPYEVEEYIDDSTF